MIIQHRYNTNFNLNVISCLYIKWDNSLSMLQTWGERRETEIRMRGDNIDTFRQFHFRSILGTVRRNRFSCAKGSDRWENKKDASFSFSTTFPSLLLFLARTYRGRSTFNVRPFRHKKKDENVNNRRHVKTNIRDLSIKASKWI